MNTYTKCAVLNMVLLVSASHAAEQAQQAGSATTNSVATPDLSPAKPSIWQDGVGNGFAASAQDLTIEAGAAIGIATFGSQQAHNLGILSLSYGHMLGRVVGGDHWYRGNFEGRLEVFGGMQYHPDISTDGWFIGLTPHLRYNFATGTRWVPFFDLGAGVSATGIGHPDLSGTFEFNLQATTGVQYFLKDNLAITGDIRYLHMSCGGIHSPNLGMNDVAFMLGVTWFFGK